MDFALPVPPYRLSGVVYATLLNDPAQVRDLGDRAYEAPYKEPPVAPVLGLKPRNTIVSNDAAIVVPPGVEHLAMGPSLGIVIGRPACRVAAAEARDVIAGFVVVNDISIPVPSHYRPAVRFRARDGFCPISSDFATWDALPGPPDSLRVAVQIEGRLVHAGSTSGRTRGVCKLLADVTEFMTLQPGDVLLLGGPAAAPVAGPGSHVRIEIEGVGALQNRYVAAEATA